MKLKNLCLLTLVFVLTALVGHAQTKVNLRVMAANLNGNSQMYEPFAIRIFQGLQPDVVAIQEFNYTSTNGAGVSTPAAIREMVDSAFGTNFYYYREPYNASGDLANGIISRYPIINSGSWTDTLVANRGFAWAQIDLPGTNDLYVVSVHLLTSSAANRSSEAVNLKALIQANFPANAWIVVGGDFNTGSRTESTTMTTFGSYVSDFPVPVDNVGNSDTSGGRNHPHDYVLPSFALTNYETATVLPSHSFPNGLVFDSAVYTPLTDVPPVLAGDSANAQHMAVVKDFSIPADGVTTNPPGITAQPASQTIAPGNPATFTVGVSGTAPFSYQWLFNGTNISGATNNPLVLTGVQLTNAGNYSVVITNLYGSTNSASAVLTVTNTPPTISGAPQNQSVLAGQTATFSVTATGTLPLSFQWLFNGTNLAGATANPLVLAGVQPANAGNYSVVITNIAGSVTSSVAALTILTSNPAIVAQWNFNSLVPDGVPTTGVTTPSIGSGVASLVGGATATFATGNATLDPAGSTDNSGWNTATYPAQGTGNKTRGAQFAVSTVGRENIVILWSSQASSTGSKYGRLQYSTNGADFVDVTPAFTNAPGSFTAKTNSLAAIPGVNNNANFAIRFVAEFESTAAGTANANYVAANAANTYGTGGTIRFDLVTVSGTAIITNVPPVAPVFGTPAVSAGQIQFTVTGTAGAAYAVQTAADLGGTWTPVWTNSAPFTYADTNLGVGPQKFYRAVSVQ